MIATGAAQVAPINRHDAQAVAALLHDEIVCLGIPLEPVHGKAATMVA